MFQRIQYSKVYRSLAIRCVDAFNYNVEEVIQMHFTIDISYITILMA